MPSPENAALQQRLKSAFGQIAGANMPELRASMDACYTGLLDELPQVSRTTIDAGGIAAQWFRAAGRPGRAMLYLHGGGFAMGSTRSHGAFMGKLAVACGIDVLGIDYRQPPEHPFPAAWDDAFAAFRWLLDQGFEAGAIVLAGDSAGGALAAALLLRLRDEGLAQPAGAVLISPWADLTHSGAAIARNADRDPICEKSGSEALASGYAGHHSLADPRLSPVFGDWHSVCPLLIMAGDTEIFMDDAVRIAAKARSAGGTVELVIGEGCIHGWPQFWQFHPEGADAVETIAGFVGSRLAN